jgi:Na+/proline symporter
VLPERHLNFNAETSTALVWLWISWQLIFRTLDTLDLRNSGKFLRVKDDSSTRKMVLMMVVPGFLLGLPILTQVPSMCAAVVFPDMQSVFPQLSNPNEGAWLAMALTVLPHGLIGLMVCTMFGAAADSADAALNSNAGFFVRNVYLRYIRPEASARNQILMGKAVTASFGLLTIIIGLMVNSLPSLNLFDLMQLLNAMLLTPMTVPMVLGLIIKKIPDWSGWSTVVAGLVAASLSMTFYTPALAQSLLGIGRELTPRESIDSQFLVVSLATASVSTLWFLATLAFLGHSKPVHRERIESLFSDLARPADHLAEGGENQDAMQYRIIGLLSQVMGGFLLLCMTIPNPRWGRFSFLLIGGTLFLMGAAFFRTYRRLSKATAHLPDQP